jgi:putative sterol carrier protein
MVEGHVPQGVGVQVPPSAHTDESLAREIMDTKAVFPTPEWIEATKVKFNNDEQYARIAKKWEGDLRVVIESDERYHEDLWLYWDLWHGKCRDAYIEDQSSTKTPALIVKSSYSNFIKILSGEVGTMQALMTRMVSVHGSMALIMRNVPTVLDFVRCCQDVTESWM